MICSWEVLPVPPAWIWSHSQRQLQGGQGWQQAPVAESWVLPAPHLAIPLEAAGAQPPARARAGRPARWREFLCPHARVMQGGCWLSAFAAEKSRLRRARRL